MFYELLSAIYHLIALLYHIYQQFPHPLESGSGPRGLIGVFVNATSESPGCLVEPKTFFRSNSLFAGQARTSCVC